MAKISTQVNYLIATIATICLRINEETNHAAFFQFAGHVNSVDVWITSSKESYKDIIFHCYNIYINNEDCAAMLTFLKNELLKLLINKEEAQ